MLEFSTSMQEPGVDGGRLHEDIDKGGSPRALLSSFPFLISDWSVITLCRAFNSTQDLHTQLEFSISIHDPGVEGGKLQVGEDNRSPRAIFSCSSFNFFALISSCCCCLLNAVCNAITRCRSLVNIQSLHVQSLKGQYLLWACNGTLILWFLHRAQWGVVRPLLPDLPDTDRDGSEDDPSTSTTWDPMLDVLLHGSSRVMEWETVATMNSVRWTLLFI